MNVGVQEKQPIMIQLSKSISGHQTIYTYVIQTTVQTELQKVYVLPHPNNRLAVGRGTRSRASAISFAQSRAPLSCDVSAFIHSDVNGFCLIEQQLQVQHGAVHGFICHSGLNTVWHSRDKVLCKGAKFLQASLFHSCHDVKTMFTAQEY